MKKEILSFNTGSAMTNPQGSFLFSLTGLKFWQPESLPAPVKNQASILIGGLVAYNKKETSFLWKEHKDDPGMTLSNSDLLECIQLWFPSIESMKQVHRIFKKKSSAQKPEQPEQPEQNEQKPSEKPEQKPFIPEEKPEQQKPAPFESETQKPEHPKPKKPKSEPSEPEPELPAKGFEEIENRISKAGLRNLWLVGPAGCGKTTICKAIAEKLDLPVTIIPCGAGTSATTFLGYKYPEREGTPFVGAFAKPGIIVLDEFTALESQVAQVANAALANNELTSTIGTFQRHPDCTIIATSNTFGHGADRTYVSNNQLDASTIDRFACGIVETDYSHEYEEQYDKEVVLYVNSLRNIIDKNGLRKIASTRAIINACKLKEAGLSWKESITTGWSKDEKALLR